MKIGTLAERYLKRAVFKNISVKSDNMRLGPGVGNDYAFVTAATDVIADGSGESPAIAFIKAMNNFQCSFGECKYARLIMLLPEMVKESHISQYMEAFKTLADTAQITILGGNTRVISGLAQPEFTVVLMGNSNPDYKPIVRKAQAGLGIVFVGYAGMLGTNLLIDNNKESLCARFNANLSDAMRFSERFLSIQDAVDKLKQYGVESICYAHDVSKGGIYAALWQLGERLNCGLEIDNNKIAVRQATIELCEWLDENPYLIDGTGGILLVCSDSRRVVENLVKDGIQATVIGKITDDKIRRVVVSKDDVRTLSSEDGN